MEENSERSSTNATNKQSTVRPFFYRVLIASMLLIAAYGYTKYPGFRLAEAVAACESDNKSETDGPWKNDKMVC
jgi:hypothetical protein